MKKIFLILCCSLLLISVNIPSIAAEDDLDEKGENAFSKGFGKVIGIFGSKKNDETTEPAELVEAVVALPYSEEVRSIQTGLNALGYDVGPVDGLMGGRTQEAIDEYQREEGLSTTGEPSAELAARLDGDQDSEVLLADDIFLNDDLLKLLTVQDVHDYEGVMAPDDLICRNIVAPFKPSNNLKTVFKSLASGLTRTFGIFIKKERTDEEIEKEKEDILEDVRLAAKKANWIPIEMERHYGDQLHLKRLEQEPPVLPETGGFNVRDYAEANLILESLLLQIDEEYPYEFKLFLTNDADSNAEAIPGGYIYLSRGALQLGVAELVLGHEIAHVTKRHTTRELQARLIESVDTVEEIKELLDEKDPESESIAIRLSTLPNRFINYSRQQELQADACGVRMATSIPDFDTDAEIALYLAHLAPASDQEDKELDQWASQHPTYPEREERIMDVLDSQEAQTIIQN